jgi:hypothetical protein
MLDSLCLALVACQGHFDGFLEFRGWYDAWPNPVQQLDGYSLRAMKTEQQHSIVMFSKKNCPKCESSKGSFIAAARLALDAGLSVRFTSIDCYYSLNLCNERGIRGVPVIKYFNGKEFDDTPWAHDTEFAQGYVEFANKISLGEGQITEQAKETLQEEIQKAEDEYGLALMNAEHSHQFDLKAIKDGRDNDTAEKDGLRIQVVLNGRTTKTSSWDISRKKAKHFVSIFYIHDTYSTALEKAVKSVLTAAFPKLAFGLVHCATKGNWKLCDDHKVTEYPTIKFYKDKKTRKPRTHDGDKDPEQIEKFIHKQLQMKKLKIDL